MKRTGSWKKQTVHSYKKNTEVKGHAGWTECVEDATIEDPEAWNQ